MSWNLEKEKERKNERGEKEKRKNVVGKLRVVKSYR